MPELPEHLLRRSAEARAKALGVPLEQVLAEMGLAGAGEATPEPIEENAKAGLEVPAVTIPEDVSARAAAARDSGLEQIEAKAKSAAASEPEPAVAAVEEPAVAAVEAAPAATASGSKLPDKLLRRSAEAKAKATGRPVEEVLAEMTGGEPAAAEPAPEEPAAAAVEAAPAAAASGSKVSEKLLRRSAEAKAKATGRPVEEVLAELTGGEPPPASAAETPAPAAATTETPAAAEPPETAPPVTTGRTTTVTAPPVVPPAGTPEGVRPQRLLTVVRAKSIQQVKTEPTDKVNVWPHLLLIEFVALLAVTAFLTVLSVILQAPLLELANFNATPNPSKAPWYFLGLQELLSYFDPQIAGVTVPGVIGLLGLMAVPYVDRNPSTKPSDRKFAIMFFTFFLVASATLTMIGTLFRGPGFNFSYPWSDGIWFDDLKDWIFFE